MQQWMDELHRVVTDAELTAQFKGTHRAIAR
jgi:hypothetical protein